MQDEGTFDIRLMTGKRHFGGTAASGAAASSAS